MALQPLRNMEFSSTHRARRTTIEPAQSVLHAAATPSKEHARGTHVGRALDNHHRRCCGMAATLAALSGLPVSGPRRTHLHNAPARGSVRKQFCA